MLTNYASISPFYKKTVDSCITNRSAVKTPAYIYNGEQLTENLSCFKKVIERYNIGVHYAVKSNNNKTILEIIRDHGLGFDVNSCGELSKVLALGVNPQNITFAGVGKTDEEIKFGIIHNVGLIKAESLDEVNVISQLSADLKISANVGLRLNPNIDAKTHPYISTGLLTSKFGIDSADLDAVINVFKKNKLLKLKGLDAHIGSQISDLGLYIDVFNYLKATADRINEQGFEITELDLGGGFGITYDGSGASTIPLIDQLFSKIEQLNSGNYKILIEPGRAIIANTCMILSKVLYVKRNGDKKFAVIDAAMTENIRPALYEAVHPIVKITDSDSNSGSEYYDVVGPVCETGDYLALSVQVETLKRGDFVGILDSGAYTSVMASNYNMRPFAPEYLVTNGEMKMIRKPQSIDSLVNGLDN